MVERDSGLGFGLVPSLKFSTDYRSLADEALRKHLRGTCKAL